MRLAPNHPKFLDPKWSRIVLIPNSGIQFLDYDVAGESVVAFKHRFHDDETEDDSHTAKIVREYRIHPVVPEDEEESESDPEGRLYRSIREDGPTGLLMSEDTYEITAKQALRLFERQWLPIPIFRAKRDRHGPTNWARVYAAPVEGAGAGTSRLHLIVAFDTAILGKEPDEHYAAPCEGDVTSVETSFRAVVELDGLLAFAGGEWQRPWIEEAYHDGRRRAMPRARTLPPTKSLGEPWAAYATFVAAIQRALTLPSFEFCNTVEIERQASDRRRDRSQALYLDVDLVLDIGNSRSCGMLVEPGIGHERVGLGQPPARFELRNLGNPEELTTEPFQSRVEFQPVQFGMSQYGRRSRRPGGKDAFIWPSALRTGPEAAALAGMTDGRDGISGMSSPKRFVWDDSLRPADWVNGRAGRPIDERLPPIRSAMTSRLTARGRMIRGGRGLSREQRYSRSSLYMLMLAEVLCHALVQVNSPSFRYRRADSALPRQLRTLFITLPSATPVAEQDRMRRHAREAIDLVWSVMGWEGDWLHPKPKLQLEWDEATCSQLVFLYNEIEHRFQAFPKDFFDTMRRQDRAGSADTLRVATLDIGGGTTDLVVIDHHLVETIITPRQLFREGFRTAGDDIVKEVIEKVVLPAIAETLRDAGVARPTDLVTHLFGGDVVDIIKPDQVRRAVFANSVLVPAAIRLMQAYQHTDARLPNPETSFRLGEIEGLEQVNPGVIDYVDGAAREHGASSYSVFETLLTMRREAIAGVISAVMTRTLEDACDAIRAYRCDVLLVTGRPVALPGVVDTIRSCAPVAPERMIPLHGYDVGIWYPFRNREFRIEDPKTTVAVGAYLLHLCRGRHASFVFESQNLRIQSTARYIGKMNQKGLIDEVAFENRSSTDATEGEFEVLMGSRVDLGYRQLPIKRWVTSQLYHIHYVSEEASIRAAKPVTLTLARRDLGLVGDEEEGEELDKEQFEIVAATQAPRGDDREGADCLDMVAAHLQTVRTIDQLEAGYWLDTGIFLTRNMILRGSPDE